MPSGAPTVPDVPAADTTRSASRSAETATTQAKPPAPAIPRLRSTVLFAGAPEIEIEHREKVYRLRQTSLGKLILTK